MNERTYKINLFGTFAISDPEGRAITFTARTASAVIAYLAINKGRTISRRDLAQAFWPDSDPTSAMTNLRTALHRVRKSIPDEEAILLDGDRMRLNPDVMQSDLEWADRLHRTFHLAANQPDGLEALAQEWKLRQRVLLDGWDFEWIEPFRVRAEIEACDVGCELAKHFEVNGQPERAATIWREILDLVPHQAEALQHALRLEYQSHGKERALELAKVAADNYRTELGIEMPKDLQKMVKAIRSGIIETVPRPELIRTRNELLLLARMFESNLRSNRTEALAMLARECSVPTAMAHPRTMLSLLMLALNATEGNSPDRVQIAASAAVLASWASEFDSGHQWAEFVIENTEIADPLHGHSLSLKGFMYFEQRQYDLAKEFALRSIRTFRELGRTTEMLRSATRLAGIQWHLLQFDEAIAAYNEMGDAVKDQTDAESQSILAMVHGNLSYVYAVMLRWPEAVVHGRLCVQHAHDSPMYGIAGAAPLGLALFATGEKKEGLAELSRAVSSTYREGMLRFNQIAVDFAATAFSLAEREEAAWCVLQSNSDHRSILQHDRSPAEMALIQSLTNYDPAKPPAKNAKNPLKGQSAATLSQWVGEELDRLSQALV